MSGLLRRIRSARGAAGARDPETGDTWSDGGEQARADSGTAPDGGQPPVPAGTDLDALVGDRPDTRRRSRMRRRLRHLRKVRELLLRDLGGLVFEVHRSSDRTTAAHPSEVVARKLERLDAVTAEIHDLEAVLDDRRPAIVREPSIGGTCPLCGELHGSDARFCWACGTPLAPGAARPVAGELPQLGEGTPTAWTAGALRAEETRDAEAHELDPGEPVTEERPA
jgi:hypothetical protein